MLHLFPEQQHDLPFTQIRLIAVIHVSPVSPEPPGKVTDLKVTDRSYTHLSLAWTKPEAVAGLQDEARGYHVEIRPAELSEWSRCNVTPSILPSYSVKGLRSMEMYWVRVFAANEGGESPPTELENYVLVMPMPGK